MDFTWRYWCNESISLLNLLLWPIVIYNLNSTAILFIFESWEMWQRLPIFIHSTSCFIFMMSSIVWNDYWISSHLPVVIYLNGDLWISCITMVALPGSKLRDLLHDWSSCSLVWWTLFLSPPTLRPRCQDVRNVCEYICKCLMVMVYRYFEKCLVLYEVTFRMTVIIR